MRAPRGELLIQQVINGGAELENDFPLPVCSNVARIWIANGLSARIWAEKRSASSGPQLFFFPF